MSRIIYFDCPSGAAGDMIMAALVDAGAPFEALREGLHGLDLGGWELARHEVRRGDFRATKVDVEIDAAAHHHHRGLADIVAIVQRSRLPAPVAERARRIFERLAGAEARVHGTTPEHVRFHDVGAVDAIVDVTGGALGLHLLGIDTVYVSPLPLGGGFVGETAEAAGAIETIVQVETTIDDMSPQLYEPLVDRLFEAGALDVFLTPVVMKRSRPGTVLTALCAPARVGELSHVLFEESSTIGVRWSEWRRIALPREIVTLDTSHGPIPFKVSRLEGRVVTVTPEFADVARIAKEKSLPVREVLDQARAEGRRLLSDR